MAGIIVTRSREQFLAAAEKLRRRDLLIAQKRRKEQFTHASKVAAELNAKHLLEPKTVPRDIYLAKRKKPTQDQLSQTINTRTKAKKTTPSVRNRKKKKKRRSVWAISGGAFESNRRRH